MKYKLKIDKCFRCGANIEITEYENGEVLIRKDCLCRKN